MNLPTCVAPNGKFIYGIHTPSFLTQNLREIDAVTSLGTTAEGRPVSNQANFPAGDVREPGGELIFEVPNPFPFRGSTFILKSWADNCAQDPGQICIPKLPSVSFSECLRQWQAVDTLDTEQIDRLLGLLPEPFQLTLAVTSTDPAELARLAELICDFEIDPQSGRPEGIKYRKNGQGNLEACIHNRTLFEALANNYHLPDAYKAVMVLKPGAQGNSEIVGDLSDKRSDTRIYEYLRRNSYIPWGHYAANMADTAVRYRIEDLTLADISGMRHLYYQRTYLRLAAELGLEEPEPRKRLSEEILETLRQRVKDSLAQSSADKRPPFSSTLWGWNFGFDFSPSRYRLHASHQQVHQQYALVPEKVATFENGEPLDTPMAGYGCGDQLRAFIDEYRRQSGTGFFDAYESAIRANRRLDGDGSRDRSLVVFEDDQVMLFVPKAQTSQWELQLMPLKPVGNILEADASMRRSLDRAMFMAVQVLGAMGAAMITAIEYPKRFYGGTADQRLVYCFLPRLPESPGAFSEAQFRWINGHYPEDFASACRVQLPAVLAGLREVKGS